MANTGNTQQQINYGATANDGLGDPLRTAFIKVDENFDNIWLAGPVGSNITIGNNTIQVNNTNGNLVLQPNGVGIIQANASIIPSVNNARDLGSSLAQWRRLYVQNFSVNNLEVPGQATITGDAVISGNLTVEGDTIQIGNIVTDTLRIQLANTAANGAQANGAGITVGANDDIATILYDATTDRWVTNIGITTPDITVSSIGSDDSSFVNVQDGLYVDGPVDAAGSISAPYFVGNGSFLTGITSSYGNSNVAAYLPTYDGALAGQTLTITSAGGNVWSINDRTLSAPNGGSWYSNPDGVDAYITSPINGYLTLQSLYSGPGFNVASQLQLEHDFARIKVINGGEEEWDFKNDGTLTTPGDIELDGNLVAANTVVAENLEITKGTETWYWNGDLMLSPAGGSWFSNPSIQEEFISSGIDGYLSLQSLGAGPGFNVKSEAKLEHGLIRLGVYNGSNKEWDFNDDGTLDVPGDILPQANATQSLGNVNLQWSELWVANNTIYLGGVALGVTGNVLTVDGQAVLSNDGDSDITTTGNLAVNAILTDGYFYANGEPFNSATTTTLPYLELTNSALQIPDVILGNVVSFEKPDYADPTLVFDAITANLHISRGNQNVIYNVAQEASADNDISPVGTLWNNDGWTNLKDYQARDYTVFADALNNRVGENVVGAELVMWDTETDQYYTVEFSSWTQGGNGGGFAYERREITNPAYFVKENYGDQVDVFVADDPEGTGIGITRGNNNGIYNPFQEGGWDQDVSPAGTLWNADGWQDLNNVTTRTYTNFYDALGGNLGNNVIGPDLVMYIPSTEQYYAIRFLSWTQGGNGGGFSYLRYEIDTAQLPEGITFADGTVQTTAYTPTDVIATAAGGRRIEQQTGYVQVSVTQKTQSSSGSDLVYQDNTGGEWQVLVNWDQVLYDTLNASGYTGFQVSPDGSTWYDASWGGAAGGIWIQIVFENGVQIPLLQGATLNYRFFEGGAPVRWFNATGSDFRGAIIEYHAYSQDSGTIVGTIWITNDTGDDNISHVENASGGNDLEYVDLWVRQNNEREIWFQRLDGSADTVKIQWVAKMFYGEEYYD